MSVIFDEKNKIFSLHTKNTSYIFGFLGKQLVHIYWGKRLSKAPDLDFALPRCMRSQSPYDPDYPQIQADTIPMESSTYGSADLRSPGVHVQYADGTTISDFEFSTFKITKGKPSLEGLPSVFASEDEAQSLEIKFVDKKTSLELYLLYSVMEEKDAICRSVRLQNKGETAVSIQRVMSAGIDMYGMDYDMVTLQGTTQRERHIQKTPLFFGSQTVESKRGFSGHQRNPFVAIASKNVTEQIGDVYAMSLVYSGNFVAGAEVDPYCMTRMYIGINPFDFSWKLDSNQSFTSPEAVLVYSDEGLGKMSRIYHDLYRENLCRSKFALKPRPVLINSWESARFDFDEAKILDIAKKASQIGVELMVLDDGWFGKRDDDTSSLGDWYVNRKKLPNGIEGLAAKVEALGMKFGLWFEPEMVSPDSDLYRKHPDWCIHVPGRARSQYRSQLILDLANDNVCEYIIGFLTEIISSSAISYVKWDMNRNMSEAGSPALPPDRQRETAHRYILGLYRILDTITARFPDVLFESCASGGGRFDAGMLFYMPQVWTSDNSDGGDRVKIQYGTSLVYPSCTMGAHVSAVPNHQIGRTTSFKMRSEVAMSGQFGFELDPDTLTEEELKYAGESITRYKKIRSTISFGDMYRLVSPFETNDSVIEYVSKDKSEVVVCKYNILCEVMGAYKFVKLCGLEEDAEYEDKEHGIKATGEELMNIGLYFRDTADFDSEIYVFEKIKK